MNQRATFDCTTHALIRAKIMGKAIPRAEYQACFPIGMNKSYQGTHFVTAHISPDVDTTIAAFWSWCDAFNARITEGLHIWNVPGSKLPSQVVDLFSRYFGEQVFNLLAKSREDLLVTGMDLVTQKGMVKKQGHELTNTIDREFKDQAIIVVDAAGFYLGDWRSVDVEGVRLVIFAVNNCLRWFENELQIKLVSLFTQQHISLKEIQLFLHTIFHSKNRGLRAS